MQLVLLLLISLNLYALTPAQTKAINLAIEVGKPYDLSNTLAGITLVESRAGLYKVNPITQDYGLTGINIHSFMRRLFIADNYMNRSKYATLLITDDNYALKAAVSELVYWRDSRQRTSWYHLVGSYNQGNVVRNNNYANKVANAIKELKQLELL